MIKLTYTVSQEQPDLTGMIWALDIKQPSVAEWGDWPPPLRQIQIEKLTRSRLKAEPECYGAASPKEEARAA